MTGYASVRPVIECDSELPPPDLALVGSMQGVKRRAASEVEFTSVHVSDRAGEATYHVDVISAGQPIARKHVASAVFSKVAGEAKKIKVPLQALGLRHDRQRGDGLVAHLHIYPKLQVQFSEIGEELGSSGGGFSVDVYQEGGQLFLSDPETSIREVPATKETPAAHEIVGVVLENIVDPNEVDDETKPKKFDEATTAARVQPRAAVLANELKACFRFGIAFDDVNNGEDDWITTGEVLRPGRGNLVSLKVNGVSKPDIHLDTSGCTPLLNHGSGTYDFKVWSRGVGWAGSWIDVHDANGYYIFATNSYTWNGSGSVTKNWDHGGNWERMRVYLAAQYATRYNDNLMNGGDVDVTVGSTGAWSNGPSAGFSTDAAKSKFTIAHEMGHSFAYYADPNHRLMGYSCDYNSSANQCHDGGGHRLNSVEWQACSAGEGVAEFFRADTWNDDSVDADCIYKTTDCEDDNTFARKYAITQCGNENGTATDIDWLRMWWDLHTDDQHDEASELRRWSSNLGRRRCL